MKLLTAIFLVAFAGGVWADGDNTQKMDESTGEKMAVEANNVKRSVKKGAHRTEETLCMDGKVKCTGKKVKHRATELKDATVDGAKELKNKLD